MRQQGEKHPMADRTPERGAEDESEEVESEPPPAAVRRKVSFADAFGLDLVSVKEYDNRDSSGSEDLAVLLGAECKVGEEFYLSRLFAPPASDHELKMRLQEQKLELESIELLPGSTTIRGIIRVLNLCFHKAVYVHTTLNGWQSHFDLLAEYVPGSSDGETDRFSFRLMLTPPLEVEGTRVEFCLRYESAVGTFWASNRGMNYVLFCHQRRRTDVKEKEEEREKDKLLEENNHREIRSCLKTISKKICTEETPAETSEQISDQVMTLVGNDKEVVEDKDANMASHQSLQDCCSPLVDRRRKRRAARLARVQDYFAQKDEPPTADIGENNMVDSTSAPKLSMPNKDNQHGHGMDTPPIIMHHQIPLLSMDWGANTTSTAHVKPNDVCLANGIEEDPKAAHEACKAFLSGMDVKSAQEDTQDFRCVSAEEQLSNTHNGVEKERCESECKVSVDSSSVEIQEHHPTENSGVGIPEGQVLDAQFWEEQSVTDITCAERECEVKEPEEGLEVSEDTKAIVPSPGEDSQNAPDTTTPNSKGGDGISPEQFTGRFDTSKVKENPHGAAGDTLTFTGIRDERLADRPSEGSSETEDLNKALGLEKKDGGELTDMECVGDETLGQSMRWWSFNESDLFTSNTKDHSELQKGEERHFEMDADDDLHTLPTIHLSLSGGNSRILSWWGDFWSLGHVTRALVYSVVLLVIFVTTYVCDLPTCLAVYLFSLCWWYSQGVKQRLDGTIDVD